MVMTAAETSACSFISPLFTNRGEIKCWSEKVDRHMASNISSLMLNYIILYYFEDQMKKMIVC